MTGEGNKPIEELRREWAAAARDAERNNPLIRRVSVAEAFGDEFADYGDEGNAESVEDPGSALRQISDGMGNSSSSSADSQGVPQLGAGGDVERDGSGSDEPDSGMGSGSMIRPITGPVRTPERDEESREVKRPRGKMALIRPIPLESRTLKKPSGDDEFPTDDQVLDGISTRGSEKKKSKVIRPIKPE